MSETIIRPCLCCDAHTEVAKKDWSGEAPAAICLDCCKRIYMGMMPWGQVKLIHQLRCQSISMQGELELVRKDIGRLYKAQQEVEQDLLRSTKPLERRP